MHCTLAELRIWISPNSRPVFVSHEIMVIHDVVCDIVDIKVYHNQSVSSNFAHIQNYITFFVFLRKFYITYTAANPNQRPRMFHAIRRGANVLKNSLPKIKDVNIIDKYSRMVFPVSFLAFNAGYWVFYVFE